MSNLKHTKEAVPAAKCATFFNADLLYADEVIIALLLAIVAHAT